MFHALLDSKSVCSEISKWSLVTGSVSCVQLVLAMVLVLRGLEKRPDLNGHVVSIVGGQLGDERVEVKLAESGKVISVESYVFYT